MGARRKRDLRYLQVLLSYREQRATARDAGGGGPARGRRTRPSLRHVAAGGAARSRQHRQAGRRRCDLLGSARHGTAARNMPAADIEARLGHFLTKSSNPAEQERGIRILKTSA